MTTTWIVVADSARARVFERTGAHGIPTELQDMIDPDARTPARDLERDRPARVHDGMGAHRHAIEPRSTAKRKALDRFARRIADTLESGRTAHRYDALVLVAPPATLGALTEALGPALTRCLADRIDKDCTRATAAEIAAVLDAARA